MTIYGQSSGACLASALYTYVPAFRPVKLFHRMIATSGSFGGWCTMPSSTARELFRKLYYNACTVAGSVFFDANGKQVSQPNPLAGCRCEKEDSPELEKVRCMQDDFKRN